MSILKNSFLFTALPVCLIASFFVFNTSVHAECDIPSPDNPKSCLEGFYSGNDILYYDPNATTPCSSNATTISTTSTLTGNSNAEKIFKYLVAKGLTAEQSAGVLGNFQQESGFDPAIIQGGAIAPANYTPINSVGFGIAQWTFTVRQAPLMSLAKSSNRSITDLSVQLDFLWQELNSTHTAALVSLKQVTSPERAAYVFHRDFEGSDDSEATVIQIRGGNAKKLYDQFKGTTAAATTTVTGACQPAAAATTADMMSDKFTIYNQCQYPPYGGAWGTKQTLGGRTVCSDGCAPTALAMISTNLTGKTVTPDETTTYYSDHNLWFAGGGSTLSSPMFAAKDFGLTIQTVGRTAMMDSATYKDIFVKGGLIMAISTGSSPFMETRHAIVLRGITADNKFLIADPGQRETNIDPANKPAVDKILTDIRSDNMSIVYAFYKQQGAQ